MDKIYYTSDRLYSPKFPSDVFYISDYEKIDRDKITYFFLYDENTFTHLLYGISLNRVDKNSRVIYRKHQRDWFIDPTGEGIDINEDLSSAKPKILRFLNCNFNYDNSFFSRRNLSHNCDTGMGIFPYSLYYKKQSLVFEDASIKGKDIPSFTQKIKDLKNEFEYRESMFELKKELISCSKVKITNTVTGVKLSMGDKEVDMTAALKNYIVESIDNNEVANTLAESYYKKELYKGNIETALNRLSIQSDNSYRSLNKKSYELLKNSTIIAIWTLIPQQKKDADGVVKTTESEMIGLARDERTKEMYHWTTDLVQDISVLMKNDESSVENNNLSK